MMLMLMMKKKKPRIKLLPRRFEQQTDAFVDDVDANDEEEEEVNSFAANKTLPK